MAQVLQMYPHFLKETPVLNQTTGGTAGPTRLSPPQMASFSLFLSFDMPEPILPSPFTLPFSGEMSLFILPDLKV